jgi:hypothetical protein
VKGGGILLETGCDALMNSWTDMERRAFEAGVQSKSQPSFNLLAERREGGDLKGL